jgi:hypothetical protein
LRSMDCPTALAALAIRRSADPFLKLISYSSLEFCFGKTGIVSIIL